MQQSHPNRARRSVAGMVIVSVALALAAPAHADQVTMTASDPIGSSSFISAGNWDNAAAPIPGNDYFTSIYRLRTPADSNDHTFDGDSLTVNDGMNGIDGGLQWKGAGSATITVDNLILDDGQLVHLNASDQLWTQAGSIYVASASRIYPKQGPIEISAVIDGEAPLTIAAGDGGGDSYSVRFSAENNFLGDIIVEGDLRLEEGSYTRFAVGASGVSTSISGGGTAEINGVFLLDLSGADPVEGDSWQLVRVASRSYGDTFRVAGFAERTVGYWSRGNYTFVESNGILYYGLPPTNTAFPIVSLTDSAEAPNAAWSWFEDERCIIDADAPNGPRLLVSSVSSAPNGDPESGDVDVLWLDMLTEETGDFELINRMERDDHDSAAIWIRPDGRYFAAYARHTADQLTRWRISTNPHDPTAWDVQHSYTHTYNTTYNNLHYLPNDLGGAGRLYNFTRAINWDPTVMYSLDYGETWTAGGKLMTMGGGSDRPYVRYSSNGDRVDFITTEEHPRDFDNSIYHGYVRNGVSYNSEGQVIDSNIFDGSGPLPTTFTPVFTTGSVYNGVTMRRAWTIDVAIDGDEPVAIFTTRANDQNTDHRFFYARYITGAGWSVHELAEAGGYLYSSESDYTGLASIDPNNPNVVVISTDIDPTTGLALPNYELYQGTTADGGATWTWIALTENSGTDNLRPLIPAFDEGFERVTVWMRGIYSTYTSWSTEAVVMREVVPDRIQWNCISGPNVTEIPEDCAPVQFKSLDRDQDGDVDLRDVQEFQAEANIMAR